MRSVECVVVIVTPSYGVYVDYGVATPSNSQQDSSLRAQCLDCDLHLGHNVCLMTLCTVCFESNACVPFVWVATCISTQCVGLLRRFLSLGERHNAM